MVFLLTELSIVVIIIGSLVPIASFIWLYFDAKGKRDTILEISKNLDDSDKIEKLLRIFEEQNKGPLGYRRKRPLDYRRNGIITIFVGIGIYFMGHMVFGRFFEGVGAFVAFIGIGTMLAGYLYPNTGKELTDAVEDFEKKKS
ncbi:MAG: hypothetical protein CBB74_00390 [Owenweeksia sp. TMED14]|nr:MAG: hypothetical protein CBB74_00390 [Owenweeksia sp. TMED14]|tara:strand:- start:289 stop:717 length:429 start_codon:yes stop_codon:yes gene_type:complete